MSLSARINGVDVYAPDLTDAEWEALRQAVKSGRTKVVVRACGSTGRLRVSHLGTRHFYHYERRDGCVCRPETPKHLRAKHEIRLACQRVGWEASPESIGDGWRADVLAERGTARVAFEVQWTRQTLTETTERQEEYRRHGVRGSWFFRTPPRELRQAQEELPLFGIAMDADGTFRVSSPACRDGQPFPLGEFVQALLSGRIQFSSRLTARRQDTEILFFAAECRRCSRISHLYYTRSLTLSACGVQLGVRFGYARGTFRPEIGAEVEAFLKTDEGRRLAVASPREGPDYTSFACRHCGTLFDPLWARKQFETAHDAG
ncbi:MAG: hypothetical protein M3P51_00290, partial [Chloroflexota bacterium]|nr:hypothetical protein [Chloroflexota bacterium]